MLDQNEAGKPDQKHRPENPPKLSRLLNSFFLAPDYFPFSH
jgi:hypothetical protein